jgi:phosphopantothenoylcysteine decarboxylase/phosphopantothenate--cysteine ligase
MKKNTKVLLGVTGGIAAYKAIDLASKLTKSGCIVKTIMTKSACEFVSPITFKSITHQTVTTKMFDESADIEHISLADWADIVVIAPATANIIGKVASGIADDVLSTTIMAATAPILFVPAMNVHMFENKIVQDNINKLVNYGYFFIEPEFGKLACGYEGKGRFPKNEEIIFHIETFLNRKQDLIGRTILITSGATREKIDPMRFITNYSSGKMGVALARAAAIRGAEVKLITANTFENLPEYIETVNITTAEEMYNETLKAFPKSNITIMAAAVSDFTPQITAEHKIKKGEELKLELKRTKDVLAKLGEIKTDSQTLVGFAAETQNLRENALDKLKRKNMDMIVANNLKVAGKENTEVMLLTSETEKSCSGSKFEVAQQILDFILPIERKK